MSYFFLVNCKSSYFYTFQFIRFDDLSDFLNPITMDVNQIRKGMEGFRKKQLFYRLLT
ncbi:hypothetical protein LINPERHAP1_LOCUS124 [Linum perenne]